MEDERIIPNGSKRQRQISTREIGTRKQISETTLYNWKTLYRAVATCNQEDIGGRPVTNIRDPYIRIRIRDPIRKTGYPGKTDSDTDPDNTKKKQVTDIRYNLFILGFMCIIGLNDFGLAQYIPIKIIIYSIWAYLE